MRQEHPVFKKPKDENVSIWRYMTFSKYVWLLDRKALFFTRVDRLEDKFEGSYPKHIFHPSLEAQITKEEDRQVLRENRKRLLEYSEFQKQETAVNCWHISDYESDAMWKLYLNEAEGVAIQSTYNRLSNAFDKNERNLVFIGVVNYIDHEVDTIPWNNTLEPLVHKNRCFEHEKELRVLLCKDIAKELEEKPKGQDGLLEFPVEGVEAKIDLNVLIEKVVISPKAEKWFFDLVESITRKNGLNAIIRTSSLA